MIDPQEFLDVLKQSGIRFYTGVPDSLMKDFLACLEEDKTVEHFITANEGLALSLAAGYSLGSGKIPLVYLQNSGLGNLLNPATSLLHSKVYSIPAILLIGWRGRGNDEPQHRVMGDITAPLLDLLQIPYQVVDSEEQYQDKIALALTSAKNGQCPAAILIADDVFRSKKIKTPAKQGLERKEIISRLLKALTGDEIIVCNTGYIGREFYKQNKALGSPVKNFFLNVGAMGHAHHVGMGLSLSSAKKVIILDGDGSLLMHLGGLVTIGQLATQNLYHIVLNNGAHESVGSQPTNGDKIDMLAIARSCGFQQPLRLNTYAELDRWLSEGLQRNEKQFVEITMGLENDNALPRPAETLLELKSNLIKQLRKE
jgi:phosphonopyruvate decarboxylase